MKKKLLMVMCAVVMTMAGCAGNDNEVAPETEVVEMTEQKDVEEHTHAYVEEVTKSATCEVDGEKAFTCECGDSYMEVIPATGHVYENYVFNEDATYLADGTETSTCSGCELTDTRTAEGTKLEYTYMDISVKKYAKQSVNVRNLPSTDGERLGSLRMNQEVTVTGQCNETKWYRIEFDGTEAYVSNNYLVNEKIVVNQPPVSQDNGSANAGSGSTGGTTTGNTTGGSTDSGNTGSGTTTPDSGSTDVGTATPEPAPAPEQTPSEPMENPNNLPILPADLSTAPEGLYWDPATNHEVYLQHAVNDAVYFDQYGNKYDYPVDAEGNPL